MTNIYFAAVPTFKPVNDRLLVSSSVSYKTICLHSEQGPVEKALACCNPHLLAANICCHLYRKRLATYFCYQMCKNFVCSGIMPDPSQHLLDLRKSTLIDACRTASSFDISI